MTVTDSSPDASNEEAECLGSLGVEVGLEVLSV